MQTKRLNLFNEILANAKYLKKEVLQKILLKEEFTVPAITSYGMNSFHMSIPDAYDY